MWLFAGVAVAVEPLKIGAIFALSGKAKNSNHSAVFGVHLAVEEINHQGGVLGRPLELLLLDNESTPIPLTQAFMAKYGGQGEIKAPTVLAYDAVEILDGIAKHQKCYVQLP